MFRIIQEHVPAINPLLSNSLCSWRVEASGKLLGEISSLRRTLQVEHNPSVEASSRASRTRHRFEFSLSLSFSQGYASSAREPPKRGPKEGATGTKLKGDRNSRVTCWSQYTARDAAARAESYPLDVPRGLRLLAFYVLLRSQIFLSLMFSNRGSIGGG